ncbi:MAG TPA: response regulator transcription factor [bacterium]|nr:response regulator transcription factor [bacterium]
MPKPSILIVEDEESIRKGLCDVFIYNGYDVDAASDGKEGLKKAQSGRYHLVILDIMLPGLDGLAVCNEIRKLDRAQPIIMLTAKGDEEDVIRGLKLGADDYIPKPFSVRELVARVEAVLRRSRKLTEEKEKVVWKGLEIDPRNLVATIDGRSIELTRREVDILRYLIQCCDRPVSRQELLKEVWGYGNAHMETRTVDIHITKLRRKVERNAEEPAMILTIRGEGYKIGRV